MRRWNNGFKRTKKPSPFGQIERFYKAKLELAGARRKHLQTRLDTADAIAVYEDALVRVRDAQIHGTNRSHVPWPQPACPCPCDAALSIDLIFEHYW